VDKEIIWSPEAVEDLESIVSYISKDSDLIAAIIHGKRLIENIENRIKDT
jgi:plasmid stabilization system protein ParE